jgi:hypothetical protein
MAGITHRIARRLRLLSVVILAALLAVVLMSVSIAAAADLHPSGFDKNCNLCLFTKAPLVKSNVQVFVPPSYSALWEVGVLPVTTHQQIIVLSGLCRAPPMLFSVFA